MNWLCHNCGHGNVFWRNYCEKCNTPVNGYDPRPKPDETPETDDERKLREDLEAFEQAFDAILKRQPPPLPLQGGFIGVGRCHACRDSGICNCTLFPSTTCGVGWPD